MQKKVKTFDDILNTRSSIRSFTNKKVSNDYIEKIIKSGSRAPSGGNFQPWYFIVIQNEKIIKNMREVILEKTVEKYGPSVKSNVKHFTLFNAKTIIAACVDMSHYLKSSCQGEIDKMLDSVEIISMGACIQNMLLEINNIGLGACWCRVNCCFRKSLEDLLDIKHPYYLVANIPLGYYKEDKKLSPRKEINQIYRII
jgi:nitroreductase